MIKEKYSIKPFIFRHLVGKDHLEFRTQKQQDALEYLLYLFNFLQKSDSKKEDSFLVDFVGGTNTVYFCTQCNGYFDQVGQTNVFDLKLTEE